MKLLERYSTQCGLKIGKQFLLEKFYPLPDNKPYILIHGSSGMPGKNYPYFNEVMDILTQILSNNGINIYQIGGKDDIPIKHCIHLQGLTSLHQTNYLIRKALLLIGNDSWTSHRAGALNIPIVELFGTTSESNHSPYQYNPRSIFLSSHRFDRKPSFLPNEAPLTIGLIPPEKIVNAVLKILGGNFQIHRKSFLIGQAYHLNIVEWVPDTLMNPDFLKGQPLICRYDLLNVARNENEQFLGHALQNRPINIVTNKEINLNLLLQFKKQIVMINFEINENHNPEYVKLIKKTGNKIRFFTKEQDKEKVSNLRFKFFDIATIEQFGEKTKENFLNESYEWTGKEIDKNAFSVKLGETWFRSNKFILSNGMAFLSKAHFLAKQPTDRLENNVAPVLDVPEFWSELDHFYIFEQKEHIIIEK